jgi:hypothetical protein
MMGDSKTICARLSNAEIGVPSANGGADPSIHTSRFAQEFGDMNQGFGWALFRQLDSREATKLNFLESLADAVSPSYQHTQ